ncbi:uncharacterized protein C2845_PM07G08590 [Panicum miliaceum]|uniref:Uncharacterized protein n=1 Tax=Panicum miliaceum TaxID=4540 RepID=A0A3L6SKK4_PANMI|nr:uncharacterized protein C2845_PM07G08590 [Panicum miliaceum]
MKQQWLKMYTTPCSDWDQNFMTGSSAIPSTLTPALSCPTVTMPSGTGGAPVSIAVQQLMREIGVQMEPCKFLKFSLELIRRELVELEGDLTRREFCLIVMRTVQNAVVALSSMKKLRHDIQDHLKRPTLLGCKVSSEVMPPTQPPLFKGLDDLSEEDLRKAVWRDISTSY